MNNPLSRITRNPDLRVYARVEGEKCITRIEFRGEVEQNPNRIFSPFHLLGYERKSDTVEFYDGKKYLGRGYVADPVGITIDLKRTPPVPPAFEDDKMKGPEIPPAPGMLAAYGIGKGREKDPDPSINKKVPCIVVFGEKRVESMVFVRLRKIEGAIIDDEHRIRYEITPDSAIEIGMPDNTIEQGYVCDSSGHTVRIRRHIRQFRMINGSPVDIFIHWEGSIGAQATADKLKFLWQLPSGREGIIKLLLIALVFNLIGVFLHI